MGADRYAARIGRSIPPERRRAGSLLVLAAGLSMPDAARGELPAVDLAAVPGVEHQDDELALVDGVEHPIVADPDAQHAVGTCDHLRSGRARIGSQGLDCLSDPAAYRLVQGKNAFRACGRHSIRYVTAATARPRP